MSRYDFTGTHPETRVTIGWDRPHEKGPRLDPARIPDDRRAYLIEAQHNLGLVKQLRFERLRRIPRQGKRRPVKQRRGGALMLIPPRFYAAPLAVIIRLSAHSCRYYPKDTSS